MQNILPFAISSVRLFHIVPHRMHSCHHAALSDISNRIVGVEIVIIYYALFSFRCGIYKYCCSVCGTVWCEYVERSANWARNNACLIAAMSLFMRMGRVFTCGQSYYPFVVYCVQHIIYICTNFKRKSTLYIASRD